MITIDDIQPINEKNQQPYSIESQMIISYKCIVKPAGDKNAKKAIQHVIKILDANYKKVDDLQAIVNSKCNHLNSKEKTNMLQKALTNFEPLFNETLSH